MEKLILALDPATYITGWSVIRVSGKDVKLVKYGIINIPKKMKYGERLFFLREKVGILIDKIKPDNLIIEKPFLGKNAKTFLALGGGYGILCELAHSKQVPMVAMPPMEIKTHLLGTSRMKGEESKKRIAELLSKFFNVKFEKLDESDAVAVGLVGFDKYISKGIVESY